MLLAFVALGALLFVFRLTNRLLRRLHAAIDAQGVSIFLGVLLWSSPIR